MPPLRPQRSKVRTLLARPPAPTSHPSDVSTVTNMPPQRTLRTLLPRPTGPTSHPSGSSTVSTMNPEESDSIRCLFDSNSYHSLFEPEHAKELLELFLKDTNVSVAFDTDITTPQELRNSCETGRMLSLLTNAVLMGSTNSDRAKQARMTCTTDSQTLGVLMRKVPEWLSEGTIVSEESQYEFLKDSFAKISPAKRRASLIASTKRPEAEASDSTMTC